MDNVIDLFPTEDTQNDLLARLEDLRAALDELDLVEPEDMNSEEYDQWAQAHEDLEDQIDDILDALDEE